MSRGHGQIQRAILTALEREKFASTFELATEAYNIQPDPEDGCQYISDAQLVATRRALANLVKEGRAFDLGRNKKVDGRRFWASERHGLHRRISWLRLYIADPFNQHTPDEIARFKVEKNELMTRARKLGMDVRKGVYWPT
jgi:hypothetical protein